MYYSLLCRRHRMVANCYVQAISDLLGQLVSCNKSDESSDVVRHCYNIDSDLSNTWQAVRTPPDIGVTGQICFKNLRVFKCVLLSPHPTPHNMHFNIITNFSRHILAAY